MNSPKDILAQEVMLRVHVHREKAPAEEKNMTAWTLRIARNLAPAPDPVGMLTGERRKLAADRVDGGDVDYLPVYLAAEEGRDLADHLRATKLELIIRLVAREHHRHLAAQEA